MNRDASLVVTDSNRRRGRRWSTLRDNVGYTEQAGETAVANGLDRQPAARVSRMPSDDSYTVAEYPGGVSARATSYGNPISFTPEFRAANAVDGDLRTSWRTGSSSDVRGEELELDFARPVDTDHLRVTQLLTGFRNRSITKLDLRFDGKDTVSFDLDDSSRSRGRTGARLPAADLLEGRADHPRRRLGPGGQAVAAGAVQRAVRGRFQRSRRRRDPRRRTDPHAHGPPQHGRRRVRRPSAHAVDGAGPHRPCRVRP